MCPSPTYTWQSRLAGEQVTLHVWLRMHIMQLQGSEAARGARRLMGAAGNAGPSKPVAFIKGFAFLEQMLEGDARYTQLKMPRAAKQEFARNSKLQLRWVRNVLSVREGVCLPVFLDLLYLCCRGRGCMCVCIPTHIWRWVAFVPGEHDAPQTCSSTYHWLHTCGPTHHWPNSPTTVPWVKHIMPHHLKMLQQSGG